MFIKMPLRNVSFNLSIDPCLIAQLKEACAENSGTVRSFGASFFGENWRTKIVRSTIETITDQTKLKHLSQCAQKNLHAWKSNATQAPASVQVFSADWGTATLAATQRYGQYYVVSNPASTQFPGGKFLNRGSALEENIFQRTTCALTLSSPDVIYDAVTQSFFYTNAFRKLIAAELGMSVTELEKLSQHYGYPVSHANKVFLNPQPQICFRGPEIVIENTSSIDEIGGKNCKVAEPNLSFRVLPDNQIFPFIEMRSEAPYLVGKASKNIVTDLLTQKIAAQLDTMILHGLRNCVLGAWGWGSYHNDPTLVAEVYAAEISKRAHHFNHIIFSINDTRFGERNFRIFEQHLQDIPLGPDKRKNLAQDNRPLA